MGKTKRTRKGKEKEGEKKVIVINGLVALLGRYDYSYSLVRKR